MKMNREMRRKAQKEWSYDQYQRSKQIRAEKLRMQLMMAAAGEDWKREVALVVPQWLQVVSLYIPPKWYIMTVKWLSRWLPPAAFVNFMIRLSFHPRIKWAIMLPAMLPAVVLEWVFMRPFIWVRRTLRTFGTWTSFKKTKVGLRMTIRYWGSVIFQKEYAR